MLSCSIVTQILSSLKKRPHQYPKLMVLAVMFALVFSLNIMAPPFMQYKMSNEITNDISSDSAGIALIDVHCHDTRDVANQSSQLPHHLQDCCRLMAGCAFCFPPIDHFYSYSIMPTKITMVLSHDVFMVQSNYLPPLPPPKVS